jgi:hypothetical protein
MAQGYVIAAMTLVAAVSYVPGAYAQARQPGAVYDFDRKGEKPSPAPRRDMSGIWLPADGAGVGTQANGAQMIPRTGFQHTSSPSHHWDERRSSPTSPPSALPP